MLNEFKTKLIAKNDVLYPQLLKRIPDSPASFFLKCGQNFNSSIFNHCLAVVGSRRMTNYAANYVSKFVGGLARLGITIVSGFMYGVDVAAHCASLDVKGKTIAVMPCGIDLICPSYQEEIYYDILRSGGAVISEYEADFQPRSWTFVKRNRIVAGLSSAVFVVEAGLKSGSLITAELALAMHKPVFVLPAGLESTNSLGIIELLKKGATPVSSYKDILKFYPEISSGEDTAAQQEEHLVLSSEAKQVLAVLRKQPLSVDDLVSAAEIPINLLNGALSELILYECIYESDGSFYAG